MHSKFVGHSTEIIRQGKIKGPLKEIEKKYPNIDLIIDLTNTDKYYDPSELPKTMKHVKIKSKGGGPVPDYKVVQKFYQVVEETLSKKKGMFLI